VTCTESQETHAVVQIRVSLCAASGGCSAAALQPAATHAAPNHSGQQWNTAKQIWKWTPRKKCTFFLPKQERQQWKPGVHFQIGQRSTNGQPQEEIRTRDKGKWQRSTNFCNKRDRKLNLSRRTWRTQNEEVWGVWCSHDEMKKWVKRFAWFWTTKKFISFSSSVKKV